MRNKEHADRLGILMVTITMIFLTSLQAFYSVNLMIQTRSVTSSGMTVATFFVLNLNMECFYTIFLNIDLTVFVILYSAGQIVGGQRLYVATLLITPVRTCYIISDK